MAAAKTTRATLTWTDDEAKLLLQCTLDYKTAHLQENLDWETSASKYGDIYKEFIEQYPKQGSKNFPHDANAITKVQLIAKLKSMTRTKYRASVDAGNMSGAGPVVDKFCDICSEIWCRSAATQSLDSGIESATLLSQESPEHSSSSSSSPTLDSSDIPEPPSPASESEPTAAAVVKHRRDLLQAKLNSHKTDRLKRKLPAEHAAQEELQIKKKMLELMHDTARQTTESFLQINTNMSSITTTMQDGFALMKQLLQPAPHHSSRRGHGQYQEYSPPYMQHPHHPNASQGHSPSFQTPRSMTPAEARQYDTPHQMSPFSHRRALFER